MKRNTERGEGKLKTFITLFILVAAIYLAFKIVPNYVNDYELKDTMESEARYATYMRKTDAEIREVIYKKVKELQIEDYIRKDDIKVQADQNRVRIAVRYSIPVELPGYTLTLNFNPIADNRRP